MAMGSILNSNMRRTFSHWLLNNSIFFNISITSNGNVEYPSIQ